MQAVAEREGAVSRIVRWALGAPAHKAHRAADGALRIFCSAEPTGCYRTDHGTGKCPSCGRAIKA